MACDSSLLNATRRCVENIMTDDTLGGSRRLESIHHPEQELSEWSTRTPSPPSTPLSMADWLKWNRLFFCDERDKDHG